MIEVATPQAGDEAGPGSDGIGRNGEALRQRLRDTFGPLIASTRPTVLIDFPDSKNSGDHAIWLGELALLEGLGAPPGYVCSVQTYDRAAMGEALGDGTILMHGGGNFGDIYTMYHAFRLKVLEDFPDNPVVIFPQTVMFYSDEALAATAAAVHRHGKVTIAARDVLSHHILSKALGGAATVVLSPDSAHMLGPLQRSGEPSFNVMWLSRTDGESATGGRLMVPDLPEVPQVQANLGAFPDGIVTSAVAHTDGSQILVSDWYLINLADEASSAAYNALDFRARSQFWFDRAMRLLSAGRVVVTDRLHAHILCSLAEIPHVFLNNSYGKNFNYFESWSRPSPWCRLAGTQAQAWQLAQELLTITPAKTTAFETDKSRWANPDSLHAEWQYRSERAASFIAPGARLLDIGCGKMMIEGFLPERCTYIPHDVVARDERTRVHDLNAGDYPPFEGADHISVLGVLEYLNEPEKFWAWLATAGARVIFTYVVLDTSFPTDRRRAMGWFNEFSRNEIVAMAERAGFKLISEEAIPPDNVLFVFDPK